MTLAKHVRFVLFVSYRCVCASSSDLKVFSCGVLMMCSFRTACSTDLRARVHRNLGGDRKNANHYQQIPLHATMKIQCARVPVSLVFFGMRCTNFCAHNLEKTTECFVFVHFVNVSLSGNVFVIQGVPQDASQTTTTCPAEQPCGCPQPWWGLILVTVNVRNCFEPVEEYAVRQCKNSAEADTATKGLHLGQCRSL